MYYIRIKNNRYVKTLCGGLPSFSEFDLFETKEDAAREIVNRAYEIIENDIVENSTDLPDYETDEDRDAFNDEVERRVRLVEDEIVKFEHWFYDGVQYCIEEKTEC